MKVSQSDVLIKLKIIECLFTVSSVCKISIALLAPAGDRRKLSEVSNLTSQIDSLINSLSENPGSPGIKLLEISL